MTAWTALSLTVVRIYVSARSIPDILVGSTSSLDYSVVSISCGMRDGVQCCRRVARGEMEDGVRVPLPLDHFFFCFPAGGYCIVSTSSLSSLPGAAGTYHDCCLSVESSSIRCGRMPGLKRNECGFPWLGERGAKLCAARTSRAGRLCACRLAFTAFNSGGPSNVVPALDVTGLTFKLMVYG